MVMTEQSRCPSCGGDMQYPLENIDLVKQHRKYAPGNPDRCQLLTQEAQKSAPSYQMLRCTHCALESAWPRRSPNANWYSLAYETLDLYPQERWEFTTCLKAFSSRDKVFEFGCGSGAFLGLCAEKGIEALGADFLPNAVEECKKKGLHALQFEISSPL